MLSSIFALVFGAFFGFTLQDGRFCLYILWIMAIVIVCYLPFTYGSWPSILAVMNTCFAAMAPRICLERW